MVVPDQVEYAVHEQESQFVLEALPELPGLDSVGALDSSSILTSAEFPSRLLILGGGYIALELGQVFRRLGAEVTVDGTAFAVGSTPLLKAGAKYVIKVWIKGPGTATDYNVGIAITK